jgi:hypothetical protein
MFSRIPAESPLYKMPGEVWEWLDQRHLAKWIVGVLLAIVALALLRLLGYDLHALTDLAKAIRGEK